MRIRDYRFAGGSCGGQFLANNSIELNIAAAKRGSNTFCACSPGFRNTAMPLCVDSGHVRLMLGA